MDTRKKTNARKISPHSSSFTSVQADMLQRKCTCGKDAVSGGECEDCRKKRGETLQRTSVSTAPTSGVPPIVQDVLQSSGHTLDPATRASMESHFDHDFSSVQIHTDAKAAASAQAVNAQAYTVGRDVVFGPGKYVPETSEGKQLLAHELTHVLQQSNGLQGELAMSQPGNPYEQEADRASLAMSQNIPTSISQQMGLGLMRQLEESGKAEPKGEDWETRKRREIANEVKTKVSALIKSTYGGDKKKAFDHFDANHDGSIDKNELINLLRAAGVESHIYASYSKIADGIIAEFDTNKNGKIEWSEFDAKMKS